MGHLQREFMTYGSAWVAMLAMLVGSVVALRANHRDRHHLFAEGVVLHGHFDVIHAHRNGDQGHLHDVAGQPVTIRR